MPGTSNIRPFGNAVGSWTSEGALAKWEEVAQEVTEPTEPPKLTERGITDATKGHQQGLLFKMPTLSVGEIVTAFNIHFYATPSAVKGFLTGAQSSGTGKALVLKTQEVTAGKGWKTFAPYLAHDLSLILSGEEVSVAFTTEKAATQVVNAVYITVTTAYSIPLLMMV